MENAQHEYSFESYLNGPLCYGLEQEYRSNMAERWQKCHEKLKKLSEQQA
jgi:hypothetical protein